MHRGSSWVTIAVVVAGAVAFRACSDDREVVPEPPAAPQSASPGTKRPAARARRPVESGNATDAATATASDTATEAPPTESEPVETPEGRAPPARVHAGIERTIEVRAADGRTPVEGARVWIRGADGGTVSKLTDASGRAVMPGTVPGFVVVEIDRPLGDGAFARHTRAVISGADAASVRIPTPVVLRGTVTAEGGLPKRVRVFVRPAGADPATVRSEEVPLREDGSFSTDVDPGRYDVWTEPGGPAATRWFHEPRIGLDPAVEEARIHLVVADGFSCVLRPEGVEGAGLLAGAYPSPSGETLTFRETANYPAFAKPFGTLRVAPGRDYDVWAKVAASQLGPAVAWGVVRAVRPGGRIDIPVRPAWRLKVALADTQGQPVRAAIPCTPWPEGVDRTWLTSFVAPGTTSAEGEAVFSGLPPIELTLHAGGVGFDWVTAEPPRIAPGTESAVVRVVPTGTLRGRLLDERGAPVRARIFLRGDWRTSVGDVTQETDPRTGRFEFTRLPPGRVRASWGIEDVEVAPLGEIDLPAAGPVVWTARVP